MKKVSINIDMGVKNNGVHVATLDNDKIISKTACNYIFDENSISFSRDKRTTKRHQRRGYKRAKFARRLINEIVLLSGVKLNQAEYELIWGLLKQRGFNYVNVEFDEDLTDEELEILRKVENFAFKDCVSKEDFETRLAEYSDDDDFLDFLQEQKEIIDEHELVEGKNNKMKKVYKIDIAASKRSAIVSMLESLINELQRNNKHRIKYIADVAELLRDEKYEQIIKKLQLKPSEFHNLICNINNFQTRLLRRYFNEKFDDKFDDKKLKVCIIKNINLLYYKGESELKNKRTMLDLLNKSSALEFLKQLDAKISITPYERRVNKNPQKCQALVLNASAVPDTVFDGLRKLVNHADFEYLSIDENGEIKSFDALNNDQQLAAIARFLDVSKEFCKDKEAYPRKFNEKYYQNIYGLSQAEAKALADFAKEYYAEQRLAKRGIVTAKLLIPCGCNTPYKNNSKHTQLGILWQTHNLSAQKAKGIEKEILDRKDRDIDKRSLKGCLKHLSETAKKYQNSFYKSVQDESFKDDKDINQIRKSFKLAYEVVAKIIGASDEIKASNMINRLLQTYNICADESKGFARLCKMHAIENQLRISGETPMCSLLTNNSVRLINGRIEMYLDRLAYEIVEDIDFSVVDELEISTEMNSFNFEQAVGDLELKSTKNKKDNSGVFTIELAANSSEYTKSKKNKKDNSGVFTCPYTGKPTPLAQAEYDHILPRSEYSYNSKANLIAVSSEGNRQKSNKLYSWENLAPEYQRNLYKYFGVENEAVLSAKFDELLSVIDVEAYTNFNNLSKAQQLAFQNCLFMRGSAAYKKALKLLEQDRLKSSTNGNQKRLSALILQKALRKNPQLKASAKSVDAKLVSATRAELARVDEKLKKTEFQDSHSHCIDASIVFYLASTKRENRVGVVNENIKISENLKYDYFKDVALSASDIKRVSKNKYLKLSKNQISRVPLFDESVYALSYDGFELLSEKNQKILRDLGLIKSVQKRLKVREFIDTKKVFDYIFSAFENKDTAALKKIKFLDKRIKSNIKKDIFSLFFDDKNNFIQPKDKSANVVKFYEILKGCQNKIYDENGLKKDEVIRLFKDTFMNENQRDSKRARGKNRLVYSLSVGGQAKFVWRKNGGYQGLGNKDIATKNYLDNGKIVGIAYCSKNILPIKIADVLDILSLSKDALEIYEIDILHNLPPQINSLKFCVSQASRHELQVQLNKAALGRSFEFAKSELNAKNSEWVSFCDEILGGVLAEFLGKPRDFKATINAQNSKILDISYCVAQTSKANKEVMKENLA